MCAFGVWPGFIERDRAGRSGFEDALFDFAHHMHLAGLAIKTQGEFLLAVDQL